ncbi:type II toxin-antitoxin system HigB family toxin [soil metagenome]
MNIIREQTIRDFYGKYPDAKNWLITWLAVARKASWRNPHEVQQDYPSADQVGDQRMVFNVKGNKYRLVVRFSFQYKHALIKWFGSHAEYDKINVSKV